MKKKVSIARALKEKNRVAGQLIAIRKIISNENSLGQNTSRSADIGAMYEEEKKVDSKLVSIKTAIAIANVKIVNKIIELDEIKSRIAWVCKINADEGIKYENATYHSSGYEVKYDAVLSKAFLREEEELLKKRADELQDEIDEYNAITYVEIEFD